ncbi:hypothetical protein ABK040_011666 [Willaertia magna]
MFKNKKKEQLAFLHHWTFDFDKCMQHEPMFQLFKKFISKENEGRFSNLLDVYKHMTNNPTYYESSLHNEKKKEIECRLKQDAFPRFVRDDSFKSYLLKQKEKLGETITSPLITNSPSQESLNNDKAVDSNNTTSSSEESDDLSSETTDTSSGILDSESGVSSSGTSELSVNTTKKLNSFNELLESLGCPIKQSPVLSSLIFPYFTEDFQSQSLTMKDLEFLEKLEKDSPHWTLAAHIPASAKEVANIVKVHSSSYHSNFLQAGGGDIITYGQHCKHLKNSPLMTSPTDLPLDKVLRFKHSFYLPFSHHDVFAMLETKNVMGMVDPQNNIHSVGNICLEPKEGERDFYCFDSKYVVPLLKINKTRILNLLGTNFYDERNQRYVVILKSQGYEGSTSSEEISYGLKYTAYSKITNNLTKITECGIMYLGSMLTKDVFVKMLLKKRIADVYQNVLKLCDEVSKTKKFPKLNEKDDGKRLFCLSENSKKLIL